MGMGRHDAGFTQDRNQDAQQHTITSQMESLRIVQNELAHLRQQYLQLGSDCTSLEQVFRSCPLDVNKPSSHDIALVQCEEALSQEEDKILQVREDLSEAQLRWVQVQEEEARLSEIAKNDRLVSTELQAQLKRRDMSNK